MKAFPWSQRSNHPSLMGRDKMERSLSIPLTTLYASQLAGWIEREESPSPAVGVQLTGISTRQPHVHISIARARVS